MKTPTLIAPPGIAIHPVRHIVGALQFGIGHSSPVGAFTRLPPCGTLRVISALKSAAFSRLRMQRLHPPNGTVNQRRLSLPRIAENPVQVHREMFSRQSLGLKSECSATLRLRKKVRQTSLLRFTKNAVGMARFGNALQSKRFFLNLPKNFNDIFEKNSIQFIIH